MIKESFFGLLILSLVLFFSCGTTKTESINEDLQEPEIQIEETIEENNSDEGTAETETAEETEAEAEAESSDKTEDVSTTTDSEEDINALYPPLEEIEEPDLIDITPEELEAQALAQEQAKEAEQNENQIAEPVEEQEELPPLPETVSQDTEAAEEEQEGTEEQVEQEEEVPVEPIIEVQTEEETEPEPEILPSRSVSLKKGETLVITYPGSGWIYMGSTSEYNNLASRGRKLGTTDTKYTLLAKEAGTQIHHFYKVDNLTGEYIDDYIEVTVLEKKGNSSTVVNAPDYSEVVPKKPETPAKATPKTTTNTQKEEAGSTETGTSAGTSTSTSAGTSTSTSAATQTSATTTTSSTTNKSSSAITPKTNSTTQTKKSESKQQSQDNVIEVEPEDNVIVIDEEEIEETIDLEPFIEKARSSISAKKYGDAYTALIQYLEFSTDNRDEALYLLGQVLESDSKYRDIKQAVETYQTLCDSYPASKYWDQANKRIVYLKRFYINIH